MATKEKLKVTIMGTGIAEVFECLTHQMIDNQASTYHKFTFADGHSVYMNDFGFRTVRIDLL